MYQVGYLYPIHYRYIMIYQPYPRSAAPHLATSRFCAGLPRSRACRPATRRGCGGNTPPPSASWEAVDAKDAKLGDCIET